MSKNRNKHTARRKEKRRRLHVLKHRVTKPRECGECTECCGYFSVKGLPGYEHREDGVKPAGELCTHLTGGSNTKCGIYSVRPSVCRVYKCLWLHESTLKRKNVYAGERPDKLGIIFDLAGESHPAVMKLQKLVVVARPVRDGALDTEEAMLVFDRMMSRGLVLALTYGPKDYKFMAADPGDANLIAEVYKNLPDFKLLDQNHT